MCYLEAVTTVEYNNPVTGTWDRVQYFEEEMDAFLARWGIEHMEEWYEAATSHVHARYCDMNRWCKPTMDREGNPITLPRGHEFAASEYSDFCGVLLPHEDEEGTHGTVRCGYREDEHTHATAPV